MALPTTIASTKFPGANYYCGPFLSSGGNVYVVVLDTTNSKIHVYKATDPTASFTEQDSANVPAQTLTTSPVLWALQDGTVLYIAAGDGTTTPAYKFHKFSMATDTWDTTIKDKAIASPTLGNGVAVSISIVGLSGGSSFVALFNGAKEQLMGAGRERVFYATSTDGGATWGTPTEVDAVSGLKRDAYGAVIVLGASDRAHFFYSDTNVNAKHRSLSGASMDTEAAVVTTIGQAAIHNYFPGVSYISGANTVIKIPVNAVSSSRISNAYFNSSANPSITVEANYTDTTVKRSGANSLVCHAITSGVTHSVFSDLTSSDLMHDSETDGGAWGTDVNEWAATINAVSANIYTRSGSNVLAVLVNDGGTVKYNEISLSSDQSYAVSGVFATG